jgi:hypothetical protein
MPPAPIPAIIKLKRRASVAGVELVTGVGRRFLSSHRIAPTANGAGAGFPPGPDHHPPPAGAPTASDSLVVPGPRPLPSPWRRRAMAECGVLSAEEDEWSVVSGQIEGRVPLRCAQSLVAPRAVSLFAARRVSSHPVPCHSERSEESRRGWLRDEMLHSVQHDNEEGASPPSRGGTGAGGLGWSATPSPRPSPKHAIIRRRRATT